MDKYTFTTLNISTVRETHIQDGVYMGQMRISREQAFKRMTELTNQGYKLVREITGREYIYEK